MSRISAREMPPADEPQPKPDEIAAVAEWISAQLLEQDAQGHSSAADRVSFRKLSRAEYANTIRDLLGVTCDATDPKGLPEDPAWHGFERIGSVITISPAPKSKNIWPRRRRSCTRHWRWPERRNAT